MTVTAVEFLPQGFSTKLEQICLSCFYQSSKQRLNNHFHSENISWGWRALKLELEVFFQVKTHFYHLQTCFTPIVGVKHPQLQLKSFFCPLLYFINQISSMLITISGIKVYDCSYFPHLCEKQVRRLSVDGLGGYQR